MGWAARQKRERQNGDGQKVTQVAQALGLDLYTDSQVLFAGSVGYHTEMSDKGDEFGEWGPLAHQGEAGEVNVTFTLIGYAARKVDQYAARKVIHPEGAPFYLTSSVLHLSC
jgi:hypothetical protein